MTTYISAALLVCALGFVVAAVAIYAAVLYLRRKG